MNQRHLIDQHSQHSSLHAIDTAALHIHQFYLTLMQHDLSSIY